MGDAAAYADAALWLILLGVWLAAGRRVRPLIRARVAEPMFNTDPDKTTRAIFGVVACALLVFAVEGFIDAATLSTFRSAAEGMSAQ